MKLNGFIGPTYQLRNAGYESQRTINLFPELDELGTGKEQVVAMLCDVPGLTLQHNLPQVPLRALYTTANGYIYAVCGRGLYNLTTSDGINFSHTLMGFLQTTLGPVYIQDGVPNYFMGVLNTGQINQVVVVDGSLTGLCFQEGTTEVSQINSGTGYVGSNFVAFQSGYFIFAQPGTINPYYAADPLNISALDQITVNNTSDQVSRVVAIHDLLWVFGNRTLSVWQNTGGSSSSNQFQQIPGTQTDGGCNAPYTLQRVGEELMWVTNDDRGFGCVYLSQGYRGKRVSNWAVENWLQSFGSLSDATAWTYQDRGHTFYCLNVPTASTTWCYDLCTNMWCERSFFNDGQYSRDLVEYHASVALSGVNPFHLVGDYQSGNLYTLDNSNRTWNGVPIYRMRTAPHMSSGLKRIFYSSFQLDVQTGVGLQTPLQVQQGFTSTIQAQTATNVTLIGSGGTYKLVGNDGSSVIPTNTVVITATVPTTPAGGPNWSGTYAVDATTGLVTITPAALNISSTIFGTGNNLQTVFTLPNLYEKVPTSINFYSNDWRGNNLQQVYPAMNTNLCTSSYDFNLYNLWTHIGVTCNPSAWAAQIVTSDTVDWRPTSYALNDITITNPQYAYGATGLSVATSGNYAAGGPVTLAQVGDSFITYEGFGTGTFVGNLKVSGIFNTPSGSGSIWVTADGVSQPQVYVGNGVNTIYTIPITVNDLATLRVNILLNFVGSTFIIYDIVLLNSGLTSTGAPVNAPDGTNTGTFMVEDTTTGPHGMTFPVTVTAGGGMGVSFYTYPGDPSRIFEVILTDASVNIVAIAAFNPTTGFIVGTPLNGFYAVQAVGGGIYRFCLYGAATVSGLGKVTINMIPPGNVVGGSYTAPYTGNGNSNIGIWGVQIDTLGTLPLPYISTQGTVMSDYITYTQTEGVVVYNIAPFENATLTISGTINDTNIYPTEYQGSFTYNEFAPNYVNIGTDPQVILSYSDDGGYTFKPKKFVSLGKQGDRYRRAIWRKLGMSRDRVWRVECNEPVPFNIIGCEIDAIQGN